MFAKDRDGSAIWGLLAYLGRYAGQPATDVLGRPLTLAECEQLARATSKIVVSENPKK